MITLCNSNIIYLVLLFTALSSCIKAVPTTGQSTLETANTIQARAQVPKNSAILNLATDVFAVQLVGTQTTEQGIQSLCNETDLSRLREEGYNTTALKEIFCDTASNPANRPLPSIAGITSNVINYSSWIWIFQAVGALKGDKHRLNLLCHLIDVESAFSVGQNGTLVKNQICNVGNGGELPVVPIPYITKD